MDVLPGLLALSRWLDEKGQAVKGNLRNPAGLFAAFEQEVQQGAAKDKSAWDATRSVMPEVRAQGINEINARGQELGGLLGTVAAKGARKPKAAIGTIFDNITDPEKAKRMALRGDHLKLDANGKYIGAPEWVISPQSLGKLRADAVNSVEAGHWNGDWYDRQRNLAMSLSDDPATQSLFARGTAAYSPQAMPKVELPAFLRQHNEKVLTGQDAVPRTGGQSRNVARAYTIDPVTGQVTIDADVIRLGKKTGPYADAKNPTIDEASLYKTANDIWHGRVMGYGSNFNRGFTPQEHGFLTGENLVLADNATKRGIRIGHLADTEWNPRRAQAATWGAERFKQLKAEDELKFAKQSKARSKYDADPEAWRKSHKGKSPPPKPTPVRSDDEIRAYAMQGLDTAAPNQQFTLTNEAVTGANTGHLAGMKDWNAADRGGYTEQIMGATGRDPTIESFGLLQTKPERTLAEYTNSLGQVEHNPGWANQVMVSNAPTGYGRGTPEIEKEAVSLAARIGGLLRGQEYGAASRFIPDGTTGLRVGDMNAIATRGMDADALKQFGAATNTSMIDQGGQQVFTRFGDAGPQSGIGKELQRDAAALGANSRRGYLETILEPGLSRLEDAGQGKATDALLAELNRTRINAPYERLDAGRWPKVAREYNGIDASLAANPQGAPLRADLMLLRQIIGDKGFSGLLDHVQKYGSKGLPAAAGWGLLADDEESLWR